MPSYNPYFETELSNFFEGINKVAVSSGVYLDQFHRFSFTKICYFKQSLFTGTVVLRTLPSMCKENTDI